MLFCSCGVAGAESELGEFELSSDSIVHPYDYWIRTEHLIKQIPQYVASTVGGFLVFPSNQVDSTPTINMARGLSRKIDDRIDLTALFGTPSATSPDVP